MHSSVILRFTVLALIVFTSAVSAQQPLPTTPAQQPPTPPALPRHHGGHHGGHHRGRHGRHRRNAARFFGYHRSSDPNWATNQTLVSNEFLHAHNWVRTQYNLPNLTWDDNLAGYARQYLTTDRYDDCKLIHSNATYGENMFWGKKLHWTPSDAVYYWYIEKDAFDFNTLKCAPASKMCGHFTQLVWRDTTRVGCALQHCHVAGTGMLIACEYDPPGNYENENPLEVHAE